MRMAAGSAPGTVALPVGLPLRVGRPGLLRLPGRRGRPTLGRPLPIAAIVLRRRLQESRWHITLKAWQGCRLHHIRIVWHPLLRVCEHDYQNFLYGNSSDMTAR